MKKKILISVLASIMCACTSAGAVTAFAATNSVGTYATKDVTSALPVSNISVTDYQGNALNVGVSGPEDNNVSYTLAALNDGIENSWAGIAPLDANGNKTLGWFIMDLGAVYPVSGISITMQHDWAGVDYVVQMSETADFSTYVTVYNNDIDNSLGFGNTFTADENVPVTVELSNWGNYGASFDQSGNIWKFNATAARYIRVTNNQYGNGTIQNYSACGEINVYTYDCAEVPTKPNEVTPVMANLMPGYYTAAQTLMLKSAYNDAKIYYTLDGSVPTSASTEYTAPLTLEVGNTYKLRAVVVVNGVVSLPMDYEYNLDPAGMNVALGKRATLTSLDGTETYYAIDAGDNIADDVMMLTDGSFIADGCFRLGAYDEATQTYTQKQGWATIDLGQGYYINKVAMSMWQSWSFTKVIIQVANNADFSDAVTVYSNDDQKVIVDTGAYSMDEKVSTHWSLSNYGAVGSSHEYNGNIWEFATLKCRYVRVTNGTNDPVSTYLTELQVFAAPADSYTETNDYVGKNLAAGKKATLTSLDGTETYYAIDAGENIADDVMMLTDGSFSVDGCFRLGAYDEATQTYTQKQGWAIVDLGDNYYINKITMSMWHNWSFTKVIIQVAKNADFSDAITIYSNDDQKVIVDTGAYSIDENVSTHWSLSNYGAVGSTNDANGNIWEFPALECRYVRVTNGTNDPVSTYLTELQVFGAEAPEKGDYTGKNLAAGKEAKLTSLDGTETYYAIDAGENIADDVMMLTDGSFSVDGCFRLGAYDEATQTYTQKQGWAIVDLGDNYYINKITMSMWHNWSFTKVIIQVAKNADFSDAITIYSNDDQKVIVDTGAYSIDENVSTHWSLSNYGAVGSTNDANGNIWEFPALECRYVRVTNGTNDPVSTYLTELQVFGAGDPNVGEDEEDDGYEYVTYIQSVEVKDTLAIETSSSFEEIGAMLNELVQVTLADGTTRAVNGSWTIENYVSDVSGKYTAIFVSAEEGDAYGLLEGISIELTVSKYYLTMNIEDKTYDGEAATLTVNCKYDTYKISYYSGETLLGAAPVNAGTYKVVAEIGEGVDYVKVEANYTIGKAEVETLTVEASDKIYDGKAPEVVVTTADEYVVKYYSGETLLDTAPVDAGTYKVVVEVLESTNYLGKSATCEVIIGKAAAPSIGLTVANKTYDGVPANVTVETEGEYTVTYYANNVALDAVPVNAGTYKVVVEIAESKNAFGTSTFKNFTITRANVTLELTVADKVYDGKAATVEVKGAENFATIWYEDDNKLESAPVNAGEYRVVVTMQQTENYNAAMAEKTVKISKVKSVVTVTYSGEKLTVDSALPTAKDFTVTGGKGTLTVNGPALTEGTVKVSYTFTPDDVNYESVTGMVEIVVEKQGLLDKLPSCFSSMTLSGGFFAIITMIGTMLLIKKKEN